MLEIAGLDIKELPFEGLDVLQEIISFEGIPVLVHYLDSRKDDIISYLVDFDETGSRRLYAKVNKRELFDYLMGNKSLKLLFANISSEFVFLIDLDKQHNFSSAKLISKYLIPDEYFPVDDSFFIDGLNDFYLDYLKENYYYNNLRENSFIITVKPTDEIHGKTVGARQAAFVLTNITNSIEGYIKTKAFNVLKNDFGDASKITRRITKVKNALSPRIAETAFHSFEVWLGIDIVMFEGQDKYDAQIQDGLIEGYKHDVLDVDFTSEQDAQIIADKYTEDERKMIFEPILKLVENDDFIISITDAKNTIKKNNQFLKSSNVFWDRILAVPTVEKMEEALNRKNKIVSIVLNLKEGENITKLTKKRLQENLLFSQEIAEVTYDIFTPILFDDKEIILSKPIKCTLTIDENDHLQLFNDKLEIHAEGNDFNLVVESIKKQFYYLVQDFNEIEKINIPKSKEIKSYLGEEN